ncbi:hypothetical protein [Dictyobacter arantiisoli]|uniref:Uncharacterized protein n=1 Tax=Dictyobacter arantiisoli TaxID=2014874 RepID=A0A5A5TG96_9CHLR|nr:hypothetical protein [Dictyobacter arantiisoli]GCF09934.1 hypothetical protein KDI_34980 [Dictyobacter arantiisoli]
MLPDMSIFIRPEHRSTLEIVGAVLLAVVILMAVSFFQIHYRKLRHMAEDQPAILGKFDGILLLFSYIFYALLTFILTLLIAGGLLEGAIFLVVWLTQGIAPFWPLFWGALGFGLILTFSTTFIFLRSRVIYEESKMLPVAMEIFQDGVR